MKYKITLNNTVYEVEVERGEARMINEYEAPAAAPAPVAAPAPAPKPVPAPAPKPAPVAAPAPAAAPKPAPAPIPAGGEAVTAPLPGTVLSLKVAEGESVSAGQVLLILEAMKMENEIVAPRGGVVAGIAAKQGAAVNTGDTLIVLN